MPDYDAEFQYDILAKSLAYEKKQQELVRKERFYNIFIGTDLVGIGRKRFPKVDLSDAGYPPLSYERSSVLGRPLPSNSSA